MRTDPHYPADTRNFDWHPQSPFYDDGGKEEWIEERAEKFDEEVIGSPDDLFELIVEGVADNASILNLCKTLCQAQDDKNETVDTALEHLANIKLYTKELIQLASYSRAQEAWEDGEYKDDDPRY